MFRRKEVKDKGRRNERKKTANKRINKKKEGSRAKNNLLKYF